MGIYYYAVDRSNLKYFSAPAAYATKSPGIFHPENPFPHMLVMMLCKGYYFDILDDSANDIPPSGGYEDITEEVYKKYLDTFKEYFDGECKTAKGLTIGMFQDFFRDAISKFQGRCDAGNISLKELNDYIDEWIVENFPIRSR